MLEVTLFGLLLHRLSASRYERWEKPLTGRLCSRKDKNISDLLSYSVTPVRSTPRNNARLGGYVILPRILDKGRATLAGNAGRKGVIAQWINTGSILRESQPKR